MTKPLVNHPLHWGLIVIKKLTTIHPLQLVHSLLAPLSSLLAPPSHCHIKSYFVRLLSPY